MKVARPAEGAERRYTAPPVRAWLAGIAVPRPAATLGLVPESVSSERNDPGMCPDLERYGRRPLAWPLLATLVTQTDMIEALPDVPGD
jgi:hypothetical protein